MISEIKSALHQKFEMTNLGQATNYLGTEVQHHKTGIFLHQGTYIQRMLTKFGLQDCNSTQLPVDPKNLLSKDTGTSPVNPRNYQSMVGSLLYATNTRPDICFAVSSLSHYMDNPQQSHLQAAKHVLRYLRGTIDHGLFFPKHNSNILHTFVDADWGRDIDTRRSTSEILHKLGQSSIA